MIGSEGAVLAIDYGTKRLGVAVSDSERVFTFPRETIRRCGPEADFRALAAIVEEDAVGLIALGLPLSTDGQEGPMAAVVREFGRALEAALERPVVYVDERYSSIEAEEHLREVHPRDPRRRRSLRDRGAATIILRTYLEHGALE